MKGAFPRGKAKVRARGCWASRDHCHPCRLHLEFEYSSWLPSRMFSLPLAISKSPVPSAPLRAPIWRQVAAVHRSPRLLRRDNLGEQAQLAEVWRCVMGLEELLVPQLGPVS